MKENIDLTKILKDVPEGTKLYSPLFGEVEFIGVSAAECDYPIITNEGEFVSDGRYYRDRGECVLFPSKDQRDWSKFGTHTNKVKVTLRPFDKVLVRNDDNEEWRGGVLTNYDSKDYDTPFSIIGGVWYKQCIPYIAETANLLGTTDTPSVEYEIEFDKSFKE